MKPANLAIEPQTIDEARLGMVTQLHEALYGDSWPRPESPEAVWRELLEQVERARSAFARPPYPQGGRS